MFYIIDLIYFTRFMYIVWNVLQKSFYFTLL